VSVGGCDRGGFCGVLLDNGNKSKAYMPVVGELVSIYSVCRMEQ